MRDPAWDLAVYFESLGIGSRTAGAGQWLIRTSKEDATKTNPQIVVLDTGGFAPEATHDPGVGIRRATVQVMVIGNTGDYLGARQKVEDIFAAVRDLREQVMNGNAYLLVEAMQEPVWLGYREKDQRPQWSLNVRMEHE